MSHDKKEFQLSNSKYKKNVYQTTVECLEYVAEIADLNNNPPPTDSIFKWVIRMASDEEDFFALFDVRAAFSIKGVLWC